MPTHTSSTASGQSTADTIAAVQSLISDGKSTREIATILGMPPLGVTRIRKKYRTETVTLVTPIAVEPIAPAKPPKTSKPKPTEDDVRERIATDELTVPFSNWLGYGWYREAGDPQDIFETDENGEQQLVGVKVDPGVLWPDSWDGPRDTDGIWISPNVAAPKRSLKRGFVLSGSQALTPAHGPAYINMRALMRARGIEDLEIGGFTYGKSLFERKKKDVLEVAPWSSMLADNVTRNRRYIAENTQFCAEMNLRPTKARPLTGLNGYIRGKTSFFAHPRREIASVPRPQSQNPVTMWTTGAITVPNYIGHEAGLKALDRHTIGFLIVEIDFDDNVFVRNVDADPQTGDLRDLELCVSKGHVLTIDEAIQDYSHVYDYDWPWMPVGCTHVDGFHSPYGRALWGLGGKPAGDVPLIDLVRARGQNVNDLFDGQSINHHEDKNPISVYRRHAENRQSLTDEITRAADFLQETSRPWCKTYVTYSNHDDFIYRWLQRPAHEIAIENSKLWHQANFEVRDAIDRGEKFDVFEWLLRKAAPNANFEMIKVDTPLVAYGVNYQFHGDKGVNGSNGSTAGLAKLGIKITKAHDHTLSWIDDCMSLGNLLLSAPYATGPTTWCGAYSVGHSDGNRQVGLLVGEKYRA